MTLTERLASIALPPPFNSLAAAFGFVWRGMKALLGFVTKHPWPALSIVLALACAVQWRGWSHTKAELTTARGALTTAHTDLKSCRDGRTADRAAYVEAQKEAAAKALAAKTAAETRSHQFGQRINTDAKDHAALARADTDSFAAAHRLSQSERTSAVAGAGSGPASAAHGDAPGLSPNLPADSVILAGSDLRACGQWVAYGLSARAWALGLNAALQGSGGDADKEAPADLLPAAYRAPAGTVDIAPGR
jgi:hypothetical protein